MSLIDANEQKIRTRREAVIATIEALEAPMGKISGLIFSIIKISGAIAAPCGVLLLFSYLSHIGAPFPSLDAGFTGVISLMFLAFVFMLFMFASYVTMPMYAKLMASKELQSRLKIFQKRALVQFFVEYIATYTPFLAFSAMFLVSVLFSSAQFGWEPFLTFFVFFTIPAIYYLVFYRAEHFFAFMGFCFTSNFFSLAWQTMLFVIALTLSSDQMDAQNNLVQSLVIIAFALATVFLHAFISRGRTTVTGWLFGITALAGAIVVMFGPGYLGGASLRLLGIGGSLPTSIILKKTPGNEPPLSNSNGCLILLMPSTVYWRPLPDDAEPKACAPNWQLLREHQSRKPLQEIVVLNRSDVAMITGWQARKH